MSLLSISFCLCLQGTTTSGSLKAPSTRSALCFDECILYQVVYFSHEFSIVVQRGLLCFQLKAGRCVQDKGPEQNKRSKAAGVLADVDDDDDFGSFVADTFDGCGCCPVDTVA